MSDPTILPAKPTLHTQILDFFHCWRAVGWFQSPDFARSYLDSSTSAAVSTFPRPPSEAERRRGVWLYQGLRMRRKGRKKDLWGVISWLRDTMYVYRAGEAARGVFIGWTGESCGVLVFLFLLGDGLFSVAVPDTIAFYGEAWALVGRIQRIFVLYV